MSIIKRKTLATMPWVKKGGYFDLIKYPEVFASAQLVLLDRQKEEVEKWKEKIYYRNVIEMKMVEEVKPPSPGIEGIIVEVKDNYAILTCGRFGFRSTNAEAWLWLINQEYKILGTEDPTVLALTRNDEYAGVIRAARIKI